MGMAWDSFIITMLFTFAMPFQIGPIHRRSAHVPLPNPRPEY